MALADPPEGDRLQILNEAWKVITKLKNPQVGDHSDRTSAAFCPSDALNCLLTNHIAFVFQKLSFN